MKIFYAPNEYSQQRQKEKKRWIYPVVMAMEAEWYRRQGHEVRWYKEFKDYTFGEQFDKIIVEPEGLPFLTLPHPDRIFTRAKDKRYQKNGNFKYHPGTYIQSASGCWYGKCVFCVEKDKPYLVRPVEDVIDEIIECKLQGYKEVFDDSATFPVGEWCDGFCDRLADIGGMRISCNVRLAPYDWCRMRDAGFRMVLFGLESGSQDTLDRVGKGVRTTDIKHIIKAAISGLEPHIAVMFGYPWETDKDALETLGVVHYLLVRGFAKTAQASFYTVPGVQSNESHRKYINRIYNASRYPRFWLNKLKDIHNTADLKYFWRQIKEGIGCR